MDRDPNDQEDPSFTTKEVRLLKAFVLSAETRKAVIGWLLKSISFLLPLAGFALALFSAFKPS